MYTVVMFDFWHVQHAQKIMCMCVAHQFTKQPMDSWTYAVHSLRAEEGMLCACVC